MPIRSEVGGTTLHTLTQPQTPQKLNSRQKTLGSYLAKRFLVVIRYHEENFLRLSHLVSIALESRL